MARSLEEILAVADSLADQFENMEADSADFRDATSLGRIHRAVQARAEAERDIVYAVRDARAAGLSWAFIGTYLGTTGEAARQRYSDRGVVKTAPKKAPKKAVTKRAARFEKVAATIEAGGRRRRKLSPNVLAQPSRSAQKAAATPTAATPKAATPTAAAPTAARQRGSQRST